MVVLPPNFLEGDASKVVSIKHKSFHNQGTHYSHVKREPTPTSNKIGVNFGTHTLLGPWALAHFLTQTNLFAKFESNSIKAKFCKVALTSTMCTSVHMSIYGVMCMNVRSMCMPWFVCMHMRSMFLVKHGVHAYEEHVSCET